MQVCDWLAPRHRDAQVAPMSGGLAENRSFSNECGQKAT
jgi:hypothetical protein